MTDFDDPRISKLPHWAQELINAGERATASRDRWRLRVDELTAQIDRMQAEYAAEHGAAVYDTWTTEEDSDGAEVHIGLGVGVPVRFGKPDDITGDFVVAYRDGGLDVDVEFTGFTIKPNTMQHPTLRIE